MKRLLSMLAAIAVAALAVAAGASAQTAPALPAPPAASNAASSSIFDALLAIGRAVGTNPGSVAAASLSYRAAIQQYNAGDLQRAQLSALTAISQTAVVPLPSPSLNPQVIPQPPYLTMPQVLGTNQADAESFVALARNSVMTCGAPGAPLPNGVQTQYTAAINALLAKNGAGARTAASYVVTQCAGAAQAYATTLRAQPAPSSLGNYQAQAIATLGPDPALAATPAPLLMPSATPSPAARHRFL